jgi:hypothetical protein
VTSNKTRNLTNIRGLIVSHFNAVFMANVTESISITGIALG